MHNLFLRLYLLIVVSVIGIGVGVNALWQYSSSEPQEIVEQDLLIRSLAIQLRSAEPEARDHLLSNLNTSLELDLTLINLDELPEQEFEQSTVAYAPLVLTNNGVTALYSRIPEINKILVLTREIETQVDSSRVYLLFTFYGLIALVVFYWIHPLSKDLTRLEKAVKSFDAGQWDAKVMLPRSSSIAHLALAYNNLFDKIKQLIENEKSMTGAISHELRTPLARTRFALQMAKETSDIAEVKQHIESIEEDVEEMNGLISELLGYASLEKTSFVLKSEKGDLATLINSLCTRLMKNFPQTSIVFTAATPNLDIRCDRDLLERAIQNLIINACKYGGQQVRVKLYQDEQNYMIDVDDDGPGVPVALRDAIFDSYYQIPGSDHSKGFGLGLAIVKKIIELHQGTVVVTDSVLGGACFTVCWPVKQN